MDKKCVKIICHGKEQFHPTYGSEHAAGADLRAALDKPLLLAAGQRLQVSTGLCVAIPEGYEGQIRPRSGLAFKHGIGLVNSPGTIDADYRGELIILLINWGDTDYTIMPEERIAQLVIAPVVRANFCSGTLDETERGEGGFGSTGRL